MKPTYFLVIFSLLTLLSSKSLAQDLGAEDSTLLAALEQLEALESNVANTDLVLAEPLFQLAEEYRRRGRFADAHSALDRGMQIVRMSGGLYTRDQLPYLEKKIENFSDWGDWESARELMEHLLWLHRNKTTQIDQPLLDDLMELARLHIRGISEDSQEFQTYHFRRASASNWLAVAAAERLWTRTDERLIPMLYSLLQQYHLQTVAVERGGRTGYELRQIVPGSDWVRDRSDMVRYFYQTGLRLLRQMEDIYKATEPLNAEALAMTQLYKADWHVMYSEREAALESYSVAFNGLLEAGVSRELADRYFARASLLPDTEFHSSLSNALASRVVEPALSGIDVELAAAESALYFAEWSPNFPYARSPFSRPSGQDLDSNFALFSFSLSGVTEISKWLSRQSVQDFGELVDITLVKPNTTFSDNEIEMRERLRSLAIRPRLVDGLPQETSATLVYQPAIQQRLSLP